MAPLIVATMASQALLVALGPSIVAISKDLDVSVGAVGQARSTTAVVAVVAALALITRVDWIGVPRLLGVGGGLAVLGSALIAVAPSLGVFIAAHVLIGLSFALLLSAGFSGVAAFGHERRAWVLGYIVGANALAWIVVNPMVGVITDLVSWRVSQAVPGVLAAATLALAPLAARAPASPEPPRLRELLRDHSVANWVAAELIAYAAWTSLLTYVGAFFIESLGVREAAVGWVLASGAVAYFLAATRTERYLGGIARRKLAAMVSVAMGLLSVVLMGPADPLAVGIVVYVILAFVAGIRATSASGLGLELLPGHPGAMMATRTAAMQLGYLLGAVIGGVLIAGVGYLTLGFVLAVGMVIAALLILRVHDPMEAEASGGIGPEPEAESA